MTDGQLTIWGGGRATGIPSTHPVRAMARRSDPPTSMGAAVVALHDAVGLRAQCLDALRRCGAEGATDFVLADMVHRGQTSAGKRRLELQRDGLVEPLILDGRQVRRLSPTGTPALVWVAAEFSIHRSQDAVTTPVEECAVTAPPPGAVTPSQGAVL